MKIIYCESIQDLIEVIKLLTLEGMTFKASTSKLTIQVLGA